MVIREVEIKLEELFEEITELKKVLDEKEEEFEKFKRVQLYLKKGVKIGTVIRTLEKKKVYKICEIDTGWASLMGFFFLRGHPQKKCGEWSKRVENIYEEYKVIENSNNIRVKIKKRRK